jgi:transposase-like protein
VWKCRGCKRQFSVLVGTIFEGTKIPMAKWLMAIYLMSAGKNGVAALELSRTLGITYKSAWFMVHRIREAMANVGAAGMFGTIVADEAFIGGKPKNRHSVDHEPVAYVPGEGGVATAKTQLLTMINPDTEQSVSTVIPNAISTTIRKVMADHVEFATSHLVTDESRSYKPIASEFASHRTVNHAKGEYVRNGASTNKVEGFFGQLKRSIDGTHHGVSAEHLQRYAREFDFRYGHRKISDGERATTMVQRGQGASLSYRSLIANGPVAMGTRPRPVGRPGPR